MRKRSERTVKLDPLTCKPLDSYSEILLFLENPPPWRSLCKELTPHSKNYIRNVELNRNFSLRSLETPETFCHYNPDTEDVKRYDSKSLRKTLVCHDLANGYHDDCNIEGTANYEAYTFYNWAGIDIFCYFSHHLITIPPLGWINIGHAHGVKVIGTIITEWAEGITFWDQILASDVEYRNLASALVAIAKTLKFDGWLLNIENKIAKPEILLEFVKYFHKLLHEELPHAVLVWYDSVTIKGNLNWQNGLNDKNKAFFDACDGFFTNYSWNIDDVTSSAIEADERVTELYIGIDVWGRNFYGGGQFNTVEAIKVAYHLGCSLAIFAPAWTHEALSNEKADNNMVAMAGHLDKYSKFLIRDRAFWGSIWPFLNTRVPCQIPFQTSFCRGQGRKRRLYGEVLSPTPWYNLRHQQYQPNSAHGPHGYILTTADKISKVTRSAQYKDKKGIIRVRSDFQMSRHELHSVTKEPLAERGSDVSVPRDDDESTDSVNMKSDTDTGADSDIQKTVKRVTMRDAFKNLFKQRALKISDDEEGKIGPPEFKDANKANKKPEENANVANSESTTENNAQGGSEVQKKENAPEEGPLPAKETSVAGPSTSSTGSAPSGRSMMQMSVKIRLGGANEKTRYCLAYVAHERECLEVYFEDSFTGGSCLKVSPSDMLSPEHRHTRLFFCDFSCEDALVFCVVTKPLMQYPEQSLNVNLRMKNANNEDLTVVLTGRNLSQTSTLSRSSVGTNYVYPLNTGSDEVFRDLRSYLLIHEPGFYVPVENSFDWTVRYYQLGVPGSRVLSVNVRTGLPQGGVLLGHFGVCKRVT